MTSQEIARRHPEGGGYARGEETRTRIIVTALRVFGELGFEQASTRFIAAEAKVNPPALQYYFDSKAGLHRACVQHIVDATLLWLDPLLKRAAAVAAAGDAAQGTDLICAIADALIDAILNANTETWSRFLARTKAEQDGPGMELLREQIGSRLIAALAGLFAAVTRCVDEEEIRLQAAMTIGQIGWFSSNRSGVLDFMRWKRFDNTKLALMKKLTQRQIRATLVEMTDGAAAPTTAQRKRR